MKYLSILLISLALGFSNAYSQKLVFARVVDYITNTNIAADSLLTVHLLAKDSSFISDGWASLEGEKPRYKTFAKAVVEREGSYIIRVSHPDYYTLLYRLNFIVEKAKFFSASSLLNVN